MVSTGVISCRGVTIINWKVCCRKVVGVGSCGRRICMHPYLGSWSTYIICTLVEVVSTMFTLYTMSSNSSSHYYMLFYMLVYTVAPSKLFFVPSRLGQNPNNPE
jgi:hypothetical protein